MSFLVQLLNKYQTSPIEAKNFREKDGVLLAIGSLSSKLKKVPEYSAALETMLITHVFPEFSNPHGFLRAKACWTFSEFADIEFKNHDVLLQGLTQVVHLMKDQELPVKIQAALALRNLLDTEIAEERILSILPQLLEEFLNLMNEIDNDELVATLEVILYKFGDHISPFAVALCQRLVDSFMKMTSSEEDENSVLAAVECLKAIQTVLAAIKNLPDLYSQVEPILLPLLDKCITLDLIEYFEDFIKIISFLTYFPKSVSPNMWILFPKLYHAFNDWAYDMIESILVPMDNFISKGTEIFLSNPAYLQMILDMYKKLLEDVEAPEMDVGNGCKLIEVVIHNCKGKIDGCLSGIISLACQRLDNTKTHSFRVLLIEVVANSLFYNPALALQILEASGFTKTVFTTWFSSLADFKRRHDKKVTVLALCSLMEVPFASLPPIVQAGFQQCIQATLKLLVEIKTLNETKSQKADDEDSDDESIEEVDEEINDEEDVNDDIELQRLADAVGQYGYDLDDDDLDDLEDEDDYITPIDNINEFLLFFQKFQDFSTREGAVYQQLSARLSPEDQQNYNTILAYIQQQQQQQQKQ